MNSFLSSILSRLLIDRKNGHRRAVFAAFKEKQRVARFSPEQQQRYRNEKLASLLNHARDQVPFWREQIREVVTVENARDVLKSLPLMTRAMIQEDRKRFEAQTVKGSRVKVEGQEAGARVVEDATGGSSGTPMRFLVDRATQIARESSLYWSDSLAGWNYGDRITMLWGSDKDNKSAASKAKLAFRWWIENRRWFNAFNMGEDRMAEFHRAMTKFKPHLIVAYAGSLEVFAKFLRDNIQHSTFNSQHPSGGPSESSSQSPALGGSASGGQIANQKSEIVDYPLTALVSSAEVLTPKARELIESVFGKRVFDRYGNREFGAIAAEDGKGGLVVNPTDMILETNEKGELLVTYLHNRAMPFIRYNTGDLVRFRDDGRMEPVAGRSADTIKTASGNLIHGEFFTHLMYRAKNVKEFQFVQETISRYVLLLVAERPESEEVMAGIRADILDEIGAGSALEIRYVEEIPVLSSGKRKFTISLV